MQWNTLNLSLEGLRQHYARNDFSPRELVAHLIEKSADFSEHNCWLYQLSENELAPYLATLDEPAAKQLPLYGVPFAIKDNIDLAGVPTTAACPAFAYTPHEHAPVVAALIAAGAIPMGKTHMDQFATGLVGTRAAAPCRNAFNKQFISGGSSSGSAVANALGLVSFALGTDTAGSGRVPAAFNRLVGLKPTKGLLSTRGVVPACRSLDVVSVFAFDADDAAAIFAIACHYDPADPFARRNPFGNSARWAGEHRGSLVIGVPQDEQLHFFDQGQAKADFEHSLSEWQRLGAELRRIDFQPFVDAAKLLYEGPWVAERSLATATIRREHPGAIDATVKRIIDGGDALLASAAFAAQYRLQALKKLCDAELAGLDALITPTAGVHPRIVEVQADPIGLNSQLGYYTNYMNLLDYCALALPNAKHSGPAANGFTLVAPAFGDQRLLAMGRLWQRQTQREAGLNTPLLQRDAPAAGEARFVDVVVCGAHLAGQPLNWQLTERGASLRRACHSSPHYRLFALADGKRPAMQRVAEGGRAIEVEVWRVPAEHFGTFVAGIPTPLGIGKVELEDGSWLSGFICDGHGLEGARDISAFGGWRAYLGTL